MRVESFVTRTHTVEAHIDDDVLEQMILAAVSAEAGVPVVQLREHGRLSFDLSDVGTPEQPRWSARFVAEIPLPVGEGR